jgi:hypothetical protein
MKIRYPDGTTEDVSDERGQELVNLEQAVPVGDVPVVEAPSKLVAEQEARWEQAKSDTATPQEKKQAELEQAHLKATDYASRRVESTVPTLAVADEAHAKQIKKDLAAAEESLGAEPAKPAAKKS